MPQLRRTLNAERLALLLLFAVGLLLRLWGLGDKGLGYDEAATALMARAPAAAILDFHWRAAFEHPPLWQLSMRAWSALFGQSEAALRLLPALAGSLVVPLAWYWLRLLWPQAIAVRLLTAALVAVSPTLVIYSQEARMYSLVVLLALLSLVMFTGVVRLAGSRAREANDWTTVALFVVINWLMVGYHYYSLLLIACEAIFLVLLVMRSLDWRQARMWDSAILLSLLPIAAWMAFSPGFHDTLAAITSGVGKGAVPDVLAFADGLWRDLSYGAFRWPPPESAWGYLLFPLVLLGAAVLAAGGPLRLSAQPAGKKAARSAQIARTEAVPWGWLVVLVALLPLVISVVFFRSLAARYILYSVPALYTLVATAIIWLADRHRLLGLFGIGLAVVPALLGLYYYYGSYQKSDYREMAAFLRQHAAEDEAFLLYAPRQHLLAKYYLGDEQPYFTAPQVVLPLYWPVNAPPVVPEEMDGQIQELLATHPAVWLVMTAQDEVDDGEFVPKYLTAVSYKQECWQWRDVDLCRFASPHSAPPGQAVAPDLLYNGELRLQRAQATLVDEAQLPPTIYVQLDWLAERKPSVDYRVTLRLLDSAGQIVAQRDDFPIGPLLPPTTWNAGDAKPGYLALPLPADLAAAAEDAAASGYQLTVNVYDPVSGEVFAEPLRLAY